MATEIVLPEFSADMTEADVIAWLVQPGDRVKAGDVIAELETDKSTVELEAEQSGVLVEIRVPAGSAGVAVGSVLAVLDPDAEGGTEPAAEPEPAPARAPAPAPTPDPAPRPAAADDVPATALARRLAEQSGVDLRTLQGSGAGGRVVKADVVAAAAPSPSASAAAAPAPVEIDTPHQVEPLSRMRRTIAARLGEAKRTVPHFYLAVECDVDRLLEVRERLNRDADTRISVNDFVVRAAALALVAVPEANVAWGDQGLLRFERVDLAVAVATDGGLITPIVRGAERKSLKVLSEELRDLGTRARDGKLRPEEYRGGTFCVSNLGMFGVERVYPIVNPPQAGILGVGAAEQRPVVRDGALAVGTRMTCTLSADHRALDGAVGARFLEAFRRRIEDPLEMLL